jgi:protein-L-isoaspartate O-methyltransferase
MGFIYAPKQGLFVAPMWTPSREDFLIEMCGEIGDEDKSLVERSEERAERFEVYSEHRAEDAANAENYVESIAGNIPMGQPILVGHHSEKRARRDAEKIENGMHKVLKMWETSRYWEERAAGAIHHAKYKELPAVRARRIKGLEADKRKQERCIKEAEHLYKFWNGELSTINNETGEKRKIEIKQENRQLIYELLGKMAAGGVSIRGVDGQNWYSAYNILAPDEERFKNCPVKTVEELRDIALRLQKERIEHHTRWINHISNRLTYEKAMLNEQGAAHLIEKKPRPKQLPLCNYRAPQGIIIENRWNRGNFDTYPQIEMTKEEYSKIYEDRRFTELVENSHRVRVFVEYHNGIPTKRTVFITDLKETPKPEAIETKERKFKESLKPPTPSTYTDEQRARDKHIEELRQAAKNGVQIVTANELFVTPPELAERMVDEAGIHPEDRVLEPSAGTGNIIDKIFENYNGSFVAVEINQNLANMLRVKYSAIPVHCADFLTLNGALGQFDRILMNPPFSADVDHVLHAFAHLKDGGRIVAIMSEHSFFANDKKSIEFREFLEQRGTSEKLPSDTFKASGTMVNTRLVIIDNI